MQNIDGIFDNGHGREPPCVRLTYGGTDGKCFPAVPSRRSSDGCRDGLPAASRVLRCEAPTSRTSRSLFSQASSALFVRGKTPVGHGSTMCSLTPNNAGNRVGDTATRLAGNRRLAKRTVSFRETAAASGDSTEGAGPSATLRRRSKAARVTVRRAKEQDYQGVADIREVIIPVGMSGASGFMGGKVVIDSPAEAEERLLMAKVWMHASMSCCFG